MEGVYRTHARPPFNPQKFPRKQKARPGIPKNEENHEENTPDMWIFKESGKEKDDMRKENRVVLMCRKEIRPHVFDNFRVVVLKEYADGAKKEYERQGYEVSRGV